MCACGCKGRKRPMELPPLPKIDIDENTLYELTFLHQFFNSKYGDPEEANKIFNKIFGMDINMNNLSASYGQLENKIKKLNIEIK